jgi:hypothetical protein
MRSVLPDGDSVVDAAKQKKHLLLNALRSAPSIREVSANVAAE